MKLKYAIPLVGALMSLGIIVYEYVSVSANLEQREIKFQEQLLKNTANNLQGDLRGHLEIADLTSIRRDISRVNFLPTAKASYLLDNNDRIIASGNLSEIGKRLNPAEHHYDFSVHDDVRKDMAGIIVHAQNKPVITSIYPVELAADLGQFRTSRMGLIIIEFDLTKTLHELHASVLRSTFSGAGVTILILLVGVFLVHLFFTKRVHGILQAAHEYTSGQDDARSQVSGNDELGTISNAFNRVADNVEKAKAELRQNEEILMSAQRIAHLGSWQRDVLGGREVWSNETYRILGLSRHDVKPDRDTYEKSIHPADRENVLNTISTALDEKTNYSVQYRIVGPDGQERMVQEQGELVLDAQGHPEVVNGTILDITERHQAEQEIIQLNENLEARVKSRTEELSSEIRERKRTEEQVRENEEKFRSLVGNIPGITYRCQYDKDWSMVFMSDAALDITGYPVSDFIKNKVRSFESVIHPDDRERVTEAVNVAVSNSAPYRIEYRIIHADGSLRYVTETGRALCDGNKDVVWLDGAIFDITELQKAQDLLVASEEKTRLIVNSAVDGIITIDRLGKILTFNAAAEHIFGYSVFEAVGQNVKILMPDVTAKNHDQYLHNYHDTGKSKIIGVGREVIGQRKDGKTVLLELSVSDFVHGDETIFVGIARDITERKEAEYKLQTTLHQLQETQSELVEAEKMASLGGLVAGIAHEINTPIGVGVTAVSHLNEQADHISGLFETGELRKKDFADFVKTAVQSSNIIQTNLNRASELVRSFKQVSVDQSSEEKRTVNLLGYIDEVLVSLAPQLKRSGHEILVDGDRNISVTTQPGAVSQIITNLVMNSVTHAFDEGEKGHIHIRADMNDEVVKLKYDDDGKGMDEDVRAKVFEPFFTTKRGSGGSGLGMHILYNQITQTLGGSVVCDSTPGHGTSFTITIPLQVGDDQ